MKSKTTTVILSLILLIYFAIELGSGAIGNDAKLLSLGALSDSGGLNGQYWRLLTYSLLHSSYAHLVLNVVLLFWVGGIVERRLGAILMLTIYAVAIFLGGTFIALWKYFYPTPTVTVGASAGVFGLLAASLVLLYRPSAAVYGQPFRVRVFLWSILFIGVAVSFLPGVSFLGHAAGLLSGTLLGIAFPVKRRDKNSMRDNPEQRG